MTVSVAVIANDQADRDRLIDLVGACGDFAISGYAPNMLPAAAPQLYVVMLTSLDGAWSTAMEEIRGSEASAKVPVVIVSALPYEQLQSIPYAGDWTVAIVEEPVATQALGETISFLLNG